MGWSYQQLMETPAEVVEVLVEMMIEQAKDRD
jgi:hypothetical protein